MRTLRRLVMVVLSAGAMLALLLGLLSLAFGVYQGVAFYLAILVVCVVAVERLWRAERRLRRAEDERLPPSLRPAKRTPRRPITFPLLESLAAFAFWYAVAVIVDRVVTGTTSVFTLAAVAPFAAFMLATITIAGRHMAFRLTAEEADEPRR